MGDIKTTSDRIARVLTFLRGFTDPQVAAKMAAAGFTQQDLDEGWVLVRKASGERLAVVPGNGGAADPKLIAQLDAWEDRWFPVADATLKRRWPGLHADVFLNLAQTSGPAVAVTVQTLVDRLERLDGKDGKAARELLAKRGLDGHMLANARDLLKQLGTLAPAPTYDPEADRKARDEGEDEMWAWYLEWSQIAQAAIKNGTLLQRLGYLQGGRPKKVAEVEPVDGAVEPAPENLAEPQPVQAK